MPFNGYKSSLNDDIWAVDYGLKSRIPGEYMDFITHALSGAGPPDLQSKLRGAGRFLLLLLIKPDCV